MGFARAACVGSMLLAAACGSGFQGLDPEVYVEIMGQLSYAESRYLDEDRADSARVAILNDLGVTGEDLVAFSEHYGEDLDVMRSLWEKIQALVDSLETAGGEFDGVEEGNPRR